MNKTTGNTIYVLIVSVSVILSGYMYEDMLSKYILTPLHNQEVYYKNLESLKQETGYTIINSTNENIKNPYFQSMEDFDYSGQIIDLRFPKYNHNASILGEDHPVNFARVNGFIIDGGENVHIEKTSVERINGINYYTRYLDSKILNCILPSGHDCSELFKLKFINYPYESPTKESCEKVGGIWVKEFYGHNGTVIKSTCMITGNEIILDGKSLRELTGGSP